VPPLTAVKGMRGPNPQSLEFPLPHLTARFSPRSSGTRLPFSNARLLPGLVLLASQMFAAAAHAEDHNQFIHNGHTIDYALVLPDHFDKSKAYPVLLALPPGDQSRQMVEAGLSFYWEAEAKRRGWVVISPSAPSGESFYTGLDQELPPLLDEVAHTVLFEGGRVHLAGVSNGGLSAYRVITEFPDRFLSLTVLPGVPPDARALAALKNLKGMPVAAFVGADDTEWVRGSREASQELDRLGIQNTLTIVPGSGHVIPLDPGKLFDLLDQRRSHTAAH
jgi:poly(3-hydroxybutyrate) depolymerase